jgi:hypothetical protein
MKLPVWLTVLLSVNSAFLIWSVFCFYQLHLKATVVAVAQVEVTQGSVQLWYRHRHGTYQHWLSGDKDLRLKLVSNEFGFQGDLSSAELSALETFQSRHDLGTFRDEDQIANFPLDIESQGDQIVVRNGFGRRMVFELNSTP